MKVVFARSLLLLAFLSLLSACAPEVGSEEWCEDLKAKDKTQWTLEEAGDFAKHCVL